MTYTHDQFDRFLNSNCELGYNTWRDFFKNILIEVVINPIGFKGKRVLGHDGHWPFVLAEAIAEHIEPSIVTKWDIDEEENIKSIVHMNDDLFEEVYKKIVEYLIGGSFS